MPIQLLMIIFAVLLSVTPCTTQDTRFRTYGPAAINGYTFPHRLGGGSFGDCVLNDSNCLADFFTVGQINDRQTGPYTGLDDGEVFLRWGFLRDTRPRRWDCHIGLDLSVTNWITTTRCYDQLGSDKYEELLRNEGIFAAASYVLPFGLFGVQRGQEYKRDVLQQIFDSEKGSIQTLIRNAFRANPSKPVVFEVGNEPNIHPAMAPEMYGWYVKMYVDAIRDAASVINKARLQNTPEIQVEIMSGGLWIMDGMPDYLVEALNRGIRITFGSVRISIPVGIKMCRIGRSWWKVKFPCGIDYKDIEMTEGMDIKSSFYTEVLPYWKKVISAAGVGTIDIANLHFYPYISDGSQLDMPRHLETLRSIASEISLGVRNGEVWLTEIGNVNPYSDSEAAQMVMSPMLTGLRSSSVETISRWYWFKNDGSDKKFELIPAISQLGGGVWSVIFGILDFAVTTATLGLIDVKEPDMAVDQKARLLDFMGRLRDHTPAQGLYEDVDGNRTLTELGKTYYGFATAQQ